MENDGLISDEEIEAVLSKPDNKIFQDTDEQKVAKAQLAHTRREEVEPRDKQIVELHNAIARLNEQNTYNIKFYGDKVSSLESANAKLREEIKEIFLWIEGNSTVIDWDDYENGIKREMKEKIYQIIKSRHLPESKPDVEKWAKEAE